MFLWLTLEWLQYCIQDCCNISLSMPSPCTNSISELMLNLQLHLFSFFNKWEIYMFIHICVSVCGARRIPSLNSHFGGEEEKSPPKTTFEGEICGSWCCLRKVGASPWQLTPSTCPDSGLAPLHCLLLLEIFPRSKRKCVCTTLVWIWLGWVKRVRHFIFWLFSCNSRRSLLLLERSSSSALRSLWAAVCR